MNLPNKLTLTRIILVPFFFAAFLIDFPYHYAAALLIFVAASITDMLDGKIARKNNMITDFGKFADPLADKILVFSAFLCFLQVGLCGCLVVIILLFREFAVTSIRLVAASKGEVVAANIWGKAKTVSQMIAIILILLMQIVLDLPLASMGVSADAVSVMTASEPIICELLMWISAVFAVISGVIYICQNWHFISEK